jgi:magnesium-transporting ATPase (P-type)
LLLKGSYLKNTDYIIGVVIYTGHETKIMQNATLPKGKVSKFMKTINHILYSVMAFQIVICIVFAYFSLNWQINHLGQFSYIKIVTYNYNLIFIVRRKNRIT